MTSKSIIKKTLIALAGYICLVTPLYAQRIIVVEPPDIDRVKEIATLLPEKPRGFGDPIQIRDRWDSLHSTGAFSRLINEADSISGVPFPELTEAIYMTYYKGKDSETSKRFIMKRRMLLTKMVWAECLTNKGRYMPAIINALRNIVNTRSWTFPAEDREKTNWEGKRYTIGLSSSAYGSDMAQALYLLNSRLPGDLKEQIKTALHQRIFMPVLHAVNTGNVNNEFRSLKDIGNHNPVELANVLGAAFAVLEDKQQRAVFAAIAEKYSVNYFESYLDDGYCTEGIGYYSYGFTHYVFLRELLWQATYGKIDLFQRPKVAKMARFAPAMEIINGVYPAISDCEQYIKPWQQLMYYLNKNSDLRLSEYSRLSTYIEQPSLCWMMFFFPNATSASAYPNSDNSFKSLPVRDYFNDAGVLTVRPLPGSPFNMGATLKGGNNAEQHNHNDLGSYSIVVGNELITGDAGLATYTPKYFTKERYDLFKTTSSYGHNVPLINGIQQFAGKDAAARIIKTGFSDQQDEFAMDLASAYKANNLKKLVRTFSYDRGSKHTPGYLRVRDDFCFSKNGAFETAIITRYEWRRVNENTIEIIGERAILQATIHSSVLSFNIGSEVIDEGPMPYTRIAIKLPTAMDGHVSIDFKTK
ncbi:MAG: heparinase II/III family protein [Niabella sp.]